MYEYTYIRRRWQDGSCPVRSTTGVCDFWGYISGLYGSIRSSAARNYIDVIHIIHTKSFAVNRSLDLQVIWGQARLLEKVHVSSFHLLFATTLSSYWLILWMEFFLKRANLGCNLVLVLILKNLSSCSSGEPHCLPSSPQSHEQALHGKAQLRAAWLPCGKTRAYPNFPLIFWYTHLERQDVYT